MSDRVFGLIFLALALFYGYSATLIPTSFLVDPVGPKTFPILITGVVGLSSLVMILRPDPDPEWPTGLTIINLMAAVLILIGYALTLKPLGFLIPTALAAGLLSFQLRPNARVAPLVGVGLSLGLFVIFKYALGLGLSPLPKALMG